jgi:hypothetical protein
MRGKTKKIAAWVVVAAAFGFVIVGSYSAWNRVDPGRTCAQCHEVAPSHETWTSSAHADLHCTECHGTALESIHAAVEKTGMVWEHFTGNTHSDDVHLNERQTLDVMESCIECHRSEHAGWLAGGHAVTYDEIFADSLHNASEKPYPGCLRCHGMFYDGTIDDLMELTGDDPAGWHIRDAEQGGRYAITCMACHQIHTPNPVYERYVSMTDSVSRAERSRNPVTAFYVRSDKIHLRSDMLQRIEMLDRDGNPLRGTAADPVTMLCMQCHSPDSQHHAGSRDDRTVTGVHAGLSCIVCHKPHSGDTRSSCIECHSDLTEQQIEDVFAAPHEYRAVPLK